jgi:hypothetical protein
MPRIFYIQAIRSGRLNPSVVVDWIMVRSEDLAAVKRQARMLAQTATEPMWNWPRGRGDPSCGRDRRRVVPLLVSRRVEAGQRAPASSRR